LKRREPVPAERTQTVRAALLELLRQGWATAHDLSRLARVREHEIESHLEHLARSLRAAGETRHGEQLTLRIEPAECLDCGYRFEDRRRFGRPGRCPECRRTHLQAPRFAVLPPDGAGLTPGLSDG
jgi:predicted Zn-ribbon and HTH transcriptional regulator